jgi:hypothetical protein
MRLRTGALAIALLCGLWPAMPAATQPKEQPHESRETSPEPAVVEAVVRRLIAEPAFREASRLEVECHDERAYRMLRVYGHGIGIWDSRTQISLSDPSIVSMLRLLDSGGFAALQESYGGHPQTDDRVPADPDNGLNATRVTCLIHLVAGDLEKLSVQLEKGEQSAELLSLAGAILDIAEDALESGIEAESLQAGLEMVASGDLAAETLVVTLHRKPARGERGDGQRGFLLTVDGPRVTLRQFSHDEGYADPMRGTLLRSVVRDLASSIAETGVAHLPANVYSDIYTDLSVQVLDRRLNVQARRFAGRSAGRDKPAEASFQSMVALLSSLPGTLGLEPPGS